MHERCVQMGLNLPIKYKIHKPKTPALKPKLAQGTLRHIDDSSSSSNTTIPIPIDGMIVRPDMKTLQFFFLGKDTSLAEYNKNPRETERRLQQQIDASFQTNTVPGGNNDQADSSVEQVTRDMAALSTSNSHHQLPITADSTIMKFACAADLLADEPNGFACVTSRSETVVEEVRDWTRQMATKVATKATDHGDFVICLPREVLWEFLQVIRAEKKKNQNKPSPQSKTRPLNQIQDDILAQMVKQGVEAAASSSSSTESQTQEDGTKLKFGHHLESLLDLMMQNPSKNTISIKKNKSNATASSAPDSSSTIPTIGEDYMLIYGFDDSTDEEIKLELNVPGGKRALGETSLQAAMRETEEEISLRWTESWIWRAYQNQKDPSLKMNRFFMLHPPDMEALKV